MIQPVELTAIEQSLWDAINWENPGPPDLDRAGLITESLIERSAIPDVRWTCFDDPAMNVGGRGKSRREIFEKNGTAGDAIYRHGNFLTHLRYLVLGPDLPAETIEGFAKILADDEGTSGMVLDALCRFVRKEVRRLGLGQGDSHEHFFMLAHELEHPEIAEVVRKAALEA